MSKPKLNDALKEITTEKLKLLKKHNIDIIQWKHFVKGSKLIANGI